MLTYWAARSTQALWSCTTYRIVCNSPDAVVCVVLTGTAPHAASQEADDCEEEQGLHAEAYEQHQGQGTRPKAASTGFNSARDLFLQQQSDKTEDIAEQGKAANPFASKAKVADPAAAYAHTVIRLHDIGVLEQLMTCNMQGC